METVDAIFLKRLTSYTRSFDLTIVSGHGPFFIPTCVGLLIRGLGRVSALFFFFFFSYY